MPEAPKQQGQAAKPASAPSAAEVKAKALGETMGATIKARINGDRKHGWGVDDSLAVIEAVANEDGPENWTLSEPALAIIKSMVNPSAARQQLESAKLLDKAEKSEVKASSLKGLLAQFGS